jgi:hypothetical protein
MIFLTRWLNRTRHWMGVNHRQHRARPRQRRRTVVGVEALETRLAPVVGATAIPLPVDPGAGYDGVVRLTTEDLHSCTGALLRTGRHVLTAAHCVDDDGDHQADQMVTVTFEMPGGHKIEMHVEKAAITVHPEWNPETEENDIAILTLPALAPSGPVGSLGAERYAINRDTTEIGQTFRVIGYGLTGVGTTGEQENPNEVQRIVLTPGTDGGVFTLTYAGQTTAVVSFNAAADQIQTALESLTTIGAGNVLVAAGPGLDRPGVSSSRAAWPRPMLTS